MTELEQLQQELLETKKELNAANDLLEYEVNKYEKQIQGLKIGIFSGIRKRTQLALDDIKFIANRLPHNNDNNDVDMLKRWVRNLENYFESL